MDKIKPFSSAREIELEASQWLARMDADERLSPQALAEFKAWINRSPAHRQQFYQLQARWQQANVLTELAFPLPGKSAVHSVWSNQRWVWPGAVATVVMVFTLWLVMATGLTRPQPVIAGNGIYETRIGEQNAITLMDGSVIELNTGSRLYVNYTDQRRVIELIQGEAYFDVSKDPLRPFEVYAGGGLVRAVGTAFAVHYQQQGLTVTVTEGRVALLPVAEQQTEPPAAVGELDAGQRGKFLPQLAQQSEALSTTTLKAKDLTQALSWREGLLMFSGEPLQKVVQAMNRYTEKTIEVADPQLAAIKVGGQFRVDDTEAMLNTLMISFNLEVRRLDNDIIQLVKKIKNENN